MRLWVAKVATPEKKFDKKLFRSPVAVVAAVEYFVDYPAEDRVLHCREYKSDQLEIIQSCEEQWRHLLHIVWISSNCDMGVYRRPARDWNIREALFF